MARGGGWRRIGNAYYRPVGNGQWEGRRVENIAPSVEAKKQMRQHVQGRIAKETEAKDCDLRFIGSMPKTLHNEMKEKCGEDKGKQRAFIRDNWGAIGGIPKNSAGLPKKKSYSFKGQRKRR